MSKLKQLYEYVEETKKNKKSSTQKPSLFSYVPESILSHKNNLTQQSDRSN